MVRGSQDNCNFSFAHWTSRYFISVLSFQILNFKISFPQQLLSLAYSEEMLVTDGQPIDGRTTGVRVMRITLLPSHISIMQAELQCNN